VTAPSQARRELYGSRQVFEPHKASLPPMGPYLREFWRRRRFAYELSRTTQKADNFDSKLGSIWLVLNPLLLATVYFLLIEVISQSSSGLAGFLHIVIGLFTWYFVAGCISLGATSVTSGGKLILNQSFPRALLPLSSVISAFLRYLPTIPVYLVMYSIGLLIVPASNTGSKALMRPSWAMLWHPALMVILSITGFGLAMIFATMTVYFRDTNKFLAYMLRMWLYLSPVLFTVDALKAKMDHVSIFGVHLGNILIYANPLGPALGIMGDVWVKGVAPAPVLVGAAIAWALVLLFGGAWIFISRERDFAVRL